MHSLFKICKKKNDEINKNQKMKMKNENEK